MKPSGSDYLDQPKSTSVLGIFGKIQAFQQYRELLLRFAICLFSHYSQKNDSREMLVERATLVIVLKGHYDGVGYVWGIPLTWADRNRKADLGAVIEPQVGCTMGG